MREDPEIEVLFAAKGRATSDYAVVDGVAGSKSIVFGREGVLLGMMLIEDDQLNARAVAYLIERGAKVVDTVESLGWASGIVTAVSGD